jgi:NAD(P)-dependent dehydrogenase (short-subunit alcohol dehydrogenase family)
VVTGAAAGLGRAEAVGLARQGAAVVVNDIAAALDASDVIDEISSAGAKVVAVSGDISQRATADELLATAEGLGGLDVVVNNAGITSSEAGLVGPVGQANYGAAKAGITALTLTASRALGRYGVCANAICPRARTAMTAEVFGPGPDISDIEEGQLDPLSPEHVVTLVQFLASPAAAEVNGQVFIVYGPQVTLVAAPSVERRFRADGSAWNPAQLTATLVEHFAGRDPEHNFSATELMG